MSLTENSIKGRNDSASFTTSKIVQDVKIEDCKLLERRLHAWQVCIDSLIREGRFLQRSVERKHQHSDDRSASHFSQLMLAGKTKAALRLLSDEGRGSVLQVHQRVDQGNPGSKAVQQVLKDKHPLSCDIDEDAMLPDSHRTIDSHPVVFDNITSETNYRAALCCGGLAGPSGIDAAA